jgi:integrase
MKGSVVQKRKGSRNWYAIIERRDESTGKRIRKWFSLKATGKRKAQIECAGIITELERGTFQDPSKVILAEFFDACEVEVSEGAKKKKVSGWLDYMKSQVSPRTHERYVELARKNIVPLLGQVKLSKLNAMQISGAYSAALASGRRDGKGGLSPRTVRHMHRILRQALKQAVRWEFLNRNPADAVNPPRVEGKAMQTYDLPQTVALIEAMRPTRMFIPPLLAVLGGLRRGEIAALRWGRVDLDGGDAAIVESAEQTAKAVRYKEPKSGKTRSVRLPEMLIEELRAWRLKQAEELLRVGRRPDGDTFVVTQADGSPLQPRSITHEWGRLLAVKKLPRIRFHDLRHTHATHLLASGIHPKIASERLGHSKVGITLDLYSHVMPGMQEDAVAKLDLALKAAMAKGS